MRERNVFLAVMGEAEAFFNKRLTDGQARYYWNECGHWKRADFEHGIRELMRTRKPMPGNFPTVVELNMIVGDMGGIDPNVKPFVRQRCHACYDTGHLVVECKPKYDPPREEIFRCGHCKNWEGEDLDKAGYRADHGSWRFIMPMMTLDEFDLFVRDNYRRRGIEAKLKRSLDLDKQRLRSDERFSLKEGMSVDVCHRQEEAMIAPAGDVAQLAKDIF